jgi:hypothetical protein
MLLMPFSFSKNNGMEEKAGTEERTDNFSGAYMENDKDGSVLGQCTTAPPGKPHSPPGSV